MIFDVSRQFVASLDHVHGSKHLLCDQAFFINQFVKVTSLAGEVDASPLLRCLVRVIVTWPIHRRDLEILQSRGTKLSVRRFCYRGRNLHYRVRIFDL